MLMSASSEFVALCQSQVALLTQGLGAAFSVVYLTEKLVEEGTETKLIPLLAYPEAAVREGSAALIPQSGSQARLLSESTQETSAAAYLLSKDVEAPKQEAHLLSTRQIVLPLMHEGVLMGLLVTAREDRAWNEQEKSEIERIAQTLAIARLLDQRREWFEQQLSQQQRLQAKQRDLFDNLLHQFRNPLTALRTFGKLLLKRLIPGDANRAIADNIVRESDRLTELLQQFDRVIELTTDDLEPQKSLPPVPSLEVQPTLSLLPDQADIELCSVADVLEPLLASATAIALERNLNLQADIPANLPLIRADAKLLREVLSNLLDNALKYTSTNGKIYVQAGKKQDKFLGIAISDNGSGIPSEDLEHIFERHYRGVQGNSQIPGTGLGLAIAKDLIEQMHGKIQVFSPAQIYTDCVAGGAGTTFIVWLPTA